MEPAAAATMVDVLFHLRGAELPRDHRWLLSTSLAGEARWLADEPGAGVHEGRLAPGNGEWGWLSGRSRLGVRVPLARAEALSALAGRRLQVDSCAVVLGEAIRRELLPHRTLYAPFVDAGTADEAGFVEAMQGELDALQVDCQLVCGRSASVRSPQGRLHGFSLMLHGLAPDEALRVLQAGLGPHRLMGCGLFVPHKSAAAVGD